MNKIICLWIPDDNNKTDPLVTTCHRCMRKTTPRTNSLDSPPMCDVVERLQSGAPDTCLKDLCSIHSRAWMVHRRNLLFASFSLCLPWHAVVCAIFLLYVAFILCLIIFPLSILQSYSCVNVVSIIFSLKSFWLFRNLRLRFCFRMFFILLSVHVPLIFWLESAPH